MCQKKCAERAQGWSTISVPKVTPVKKNAHESSSKLKKKWKSDTTLLKRINSKKQRRTISQRGIEKIDSKLVYEDEISTPPDDGGVEHKKNLPNFVNFAILF